MAKYTREDIVKLVKEENVKYIRLQFTDILGTIKNVEIPVSQLEKRLIIKSCLTVLLLKDSFASKSQTCICIQI